MKHNGIKSALIICIFMSSLLFANAQRHSNPLIIPIWHQTDPWNARCPGVGQTRAHAGSHALAMAKTMKYWSYPNQGMGSVSYTDDDFGAIVVSFTPEINWGGMSNTLVFQTTQRFIYTCGAAALTDYEYEYSTSSLTNVRNALINNFRYDDSMQILQRSAFSNFEWKDLIRMELDNLRVVIYTATLTSGREIAFIVDAYNDEGLFHINFSDVNNQEMWVELNDLTVMGEAIPNSGQQMLTGIQPSLGPDTITENFESGFGHHNWQFSGNTQWTISSESFYYGSHSAKSGNIDHNQSSSLFLVMDVFEDDSISFYKRVSCEAQTEHLYDHLAFFIDGVEMQRWSGDGTWESHTYPVTAGLHEFRWTYFKDGASVYFSDCAWVDAISLPEGTTPLNAPLNLQAQVVDGNDVSLHWAAPQPVNPGLTGYRIFRNEAEIAQLLNPSLVNFTDANLPNGDYTYYLKALYSAGASNPGNSVEVNVQVPYPPQNLTANVIGLDSVELNWQVPPIILNRSLMGYYVYRNGTVVAQIENPGATTYLDADLAEGAYYYHVSALYNVGESPLSNGAMAALGVPEPPSGLQAVVSGNNVSLSWNQVQVPQALTGFKVIRNGAVIAQINDTQQLAYLDQGLRNGNYSYAVRALYGDTESASSAAVNVSIELVYAPVNLSTEVIGNDVHLVWEMPDMVRALSHYFVYRNGNLIAGVFNPTATQYSDYDLPNGIYEYRISAWYSGVESPRSEPALAEVEILYPPRNLTAAEVQPGHVLLAWQHPVTYAARAYLGTKLFVNGNQYGDIIPATGNSLQIYLAGGEYSFALKAVYGSGESSPITCSLTVIGWMEPVSEILYNIADDDIILSWNPVQEPSALYLIHRDGVLIGQTTNSSYTDANLSNGSYQYHIIVQHPNGVSDPSPVLNVILEVLYPPTDLQATVTDNDVNLVWTAPASSGGLSRSLLGYRIWRNDALLTPNPISGTSYLDSDLINGSHSYQVAAVYSSGTSAPCEAAQATIAVQYPPHSLTAQTLGGVITLSWAMDQPLQPDFISYRVYKDGSFLSETNSATYEDWGLAPGTYQYYVTAVYASGESVPTEPLSVELDYTFIPTIVTASVSGSSVSLHWAYVTPLPGIVITGYELWRNDQLLTTQNENDYLDENLDNGNYQYYVKVAYVHGTSVASNLLNVTVEVAYPPRELSGTVSGNEATLSWLPPVTGPREMLSYLVYRNDRQIASISDTIYHDIGLANGSHTYYVKAQYSSGVSPASNTITLDVEIPYPPQNLQAAVSADTVNLSWDTPATAPRALLSYSIYRDGVLIGQSTGQSYSDSGLANGSYQYYVTALYDSGESISSNLVTAVVEVPYPPQNLSCSTEGTTANLVWELPLTGPRALLSYNIYRDGSFVGSSTELAFSESGLANGSYSYHVTALYSSGESPASNVTIATIDFPYPPQNLQAAVTADTVNLSWDTPATAPRALLSYSIYRDGVLIGQTLSQSYSDSGLANGSYQYYVTAIYDSGESVPSNAVTAFVEVPYPPTQLSATVTEDSILLSWSTPIFSPLRSFLGYFIYRNGILHQSISNPALTEWLDAGLANGSYSYYLIARYDAGLSMPSNTVDVIVNVMPDLFPPENLVLNLVGERSAHLSWSAPEGNPQFYRIYRNDVELRTTTATSYLDENLDNGTYDYHVKAQYPEGLSSASNTATLNLMVAYPPQSFDGSISSGNSVTLSWLAPDQGEIGYILRRNGAQLAIINDPQILTYMDENLANGSYSYQIAAIYPDLISDFTDIFAISIEIIYPPRDFSLAAQGDFVDLSWNAPLDSGGLVAYRLYRNGSLLIEGTSLSHHDANLPNGNYEYQLSTLYSFGESALSEALPASVQIAYPAANLQASLQDDDILLSWDPVSDAGFFDTYKLFRNGEQIASTASATYSDNDLPNGSYSYLVIASYSFGDADATDSVTMNLELLYPPTGLSCQVQDTDVTLSWTPPVNQGGLRGLLGYQINRNNQNYATTTEPALLDADLDNGTYSYQVFALYDSGLSSGSSPVSVDILYPYSPSGFSILMQDSLSVRLDWIPPVQGETAFGIWRNEQQIAFLTDTTLNSYLDTDLPNGNHTYHIIAHYGDVASAPTEDLMLQILNAYPPQNLSCVMVGADVNLQWSAPDDTWGLEEYIVYQNSEELVRTSQTSFLISTVPNGEYSYMIKTRYGSTISEPSNECSLTVHNAHPVTNFTATLSDNVALLSWIQPWDLGGFEYIKVYRDGLLIGQPVNRVFTDTLSVNGDYTYQVCAHYSWADSEMSPSHTLHFVQNHIPQNFTAQVTGNDVSLSWIAPDDTTFLNGYRLYRNEALLVQTTETSYTDPDRPNGMYTYRLHSLYDDQESYPNIAQVSIVLPQSPQNVVAEVIYSNCVQITWDSLSMVYGFENYQLWRNGSKIYEGRIDSYIDVVPNGLYHYSVIAVYQDSVSEPSAEASLSVIVPQPLLEASYTIDANNVTFHWQAPEDTYGFTGVEIWRGASLVATVLPEAGNSYCDVNVGNGSHFYELRSVYGDHGYRPTSFRVMIVVPHSPGNFRGEVNGHLITLFWDPPADMYYMEGYRLIQGSQVINLGREAVSYNVDALPNGSYEYGLQSVYEGPNLSALQTISLNISQVYPVSGVTAFRMETAISIHWEAPQCLFAPSSYEIHLLPGGPDTPVGEWILLESDCQEIFYLDSEHGGIEHGYFAWAVTAKWDNTTGGIPVISNVVYLEEIPEYTWLIGNYPNPFNPHTKIRFWLKEYGPVSLVVYNARGQKVRTLVNESMTPGTHNVDFDGKDDAGRDLGSGVYFSLLKSGSYHRIRKMILSK